MCLSIYSLRSGGLKEIGAGKQTENWRFPYFSPTLPPPFPSKTAATQAKAFNQIFKISVRCQSTHN